MISIWIIKGVPLTIQTTKFTKYRSGRKWDMDPNMMTSPSGSAPSKVIKNNFRVCRNPILSEWMTIVNCWAISSMIMGTVLYKNYFSMSAACTL